MIANTIMGISVMEEKQKAILQQRKRLDLDTEVIGQQSVSAFTTGQSQI